MDQPTVSSLSFLHFLLLLTLVYASVNATTELLGDREETSELVVPKTSNENDLKNRLSKEQVVEPYREDEDEEEEDEEDDEEENEKSNFREGEEEEYEGEERDEYEDELKALAESHEAMSKDENHEGRMNERNVTSVTMTSPTPEKSSDTMKSFESYEHIPENRSDEDVASNEAVINEVIQKNRDKEVEGLLEYRRQKKKKGNEQWEKRKDGDKKTNEKKKRVPTVKKELSTQKEILISSNETQVPKDLVPSEDTFNRLSKESDLVESRDFEGSERDVDDQQKDMETSQESPRKLDKRQQQVFLKNLTSYLLKEYEAQQEEENKFQELTVEDNAAAKSLLKLLVKLAKDPKRWERVHNILAKVEEGLENSVDSRDADKRNYDTDTTFSTTATFVNEPKKGQRKPKKKKKKPKHRLAYSVTKFTTLSPMSTTERSWQTTPVQWRLVAEKLFGPSWQEDSNSETRNEEIQYPSVSKSRTRFIDRNEQIEEDAKNMDARRDSLLLQKARKLVDQSRRYHFGKVNTHQPVHMQEQLDYPNVYDPQSDPMRHYDPSERAFQRLRYSQIAPPPRDFLRNRSPDDYQDDVGFQDEEFLQNEEYRPSNRNFVMNKYWPLDEPLKTSWKANERGITPRLPNKWSWRQSEGDDKFWPVHPKPWQPVKDYWTPPDTTETKEESETEQQRVEEPRLPFSWELDGANTWQKSDNSKTFDSKTTSWEKDSYKPNKLKIDHENQNKNSMPKEDITTWNSLNSNTATWSYKSSDKKPWSKDESINSYNSNSNLIRKLVLDKNNNVNWPTKGTDALYDSIPDKHSTLTINQNAYPLFKNTSTNVDSKYKEPRDMISDANTWLRKSSILDDPRDWKMSRNDKNLMQNDNADSWYVKNEELMQKTWSAEDFLPAMLPKIQSVGAWVMPADKSTWMPYRFKSSPAVEQIPSNRQRQSWTSKHIDSTLPYEKSNEDAFPLSERPRNNDFWFAENASPQNERNDRDPWSSRPNKANVWPSKHAATLNWASSNRKADLHGSVQSRPKGGSTYSWNKEDEDINWEQKSIHDKGQLENANGANSHVTFSWTSENRSSRVNPNDTHQSQEAASYNRADDRIGSSPTRWKQFTYHRVNSLPLLQTGSTLDASSKSKNAFVAVSAVPPQRYGENNWSNWSNDPREMSNVNRKEEARFNVKNSMIDRLRSEVEQPIYAWKKNTLNLNSSTMSKNNGSDPLEKQLEELKEREYSISADNLAQGESVQMAVGGLNLTSTQQRDGKEAKESAENRSKMRQQMSMK